MPIIKGDKQQKFSKNQNDRIKINKKIIINFLNTPFLSGMPFIIKIKTNVYFCERRFKDKEMKLKRVLKFYFSAEKLNRALDDIITRNALASADFTVSAKYCAEKICKVIETKKSLSALYGYIDGVMCGFKDGEKKALGYYASLKTGILALPDDARREIKRVLSKFSRRSGGILRFGDGLCAVNAYYALM